MPLPLFDVNWLAIVVAAVVAFVVGFLWYGPLCGKAWSDGMGFGDMTPEALKEMQKGAMPGYLASFVANLVVAWGLSVVFGALGVGTVGRALGVTVILWLAFNLAPTVTGLFFRGPKSPAPVVYWIDVSHRLSMMMAVAIVVTLLA